MLFMAQAEAKLLKLLFSSPGTTNGGNYGLSRVAKRSLLPPFSGAMTPTASTMLLHHRAYYRRGSDSPQGNVE